MNDGAARRAEEPDRYRETIRQSAIWGVKFIMVAHAWKYRKW